MTGRHDLPVRLQSAWLFSYLASFSRTDDPSSHYRVNRQGCVKVDLYPYYISSKLAGQAVTLSIQAKEQSLQVVYPQEYRRSLPRVWLTSTGTALSGVSRTHAARSLHPTAFAGLREVERPL